MNKITWFYNWEKRLWGDKTEANRYFATISILFAALLGAIFAGGELIAEMANLYEAKTPLVAILALAAVVYSLNVAESVMATTTAGTAFGRSALLLLCMAVGLVVGVVAAVVVALIIGIFFIVLAIGGMLSGGSNSGSTSGSNPGMYGYDENGSQVNLTDEGGGYARDEYGHRWKNAGGSSWTKDE